jgi:hypothetical protein
MAGIVKSLESIDDIQEIAVSAVKAVKVLQGGGFGQYMKVLMLMFAAAQSAGELVHDGPEALPELKDLDAAEAGQLSARAYELVVAVLAALKAA